MSTPTTPTRQTVAQIKAADIHGEHPLYPRNDWQAEAAPTPSRGALRAAKRIVGEFNISFPTVSGQVRTVPELVSIRVLADAIDRETHAGELAEALSDVLATYGAPPLGKSCLASVQNARVLLAAYNAS